ncbi:MAG: hypothetical protein H9534_04875 [Dolichospermum circinale Clear-D4]|nr:hypothetical protein [Dolichospermum circinale Clear-D4]
MNTSRIELAKETLKTHKENMRKTLEHRLQAAINQNDENLLRQLEAEMREHSEDSQSSTVKVDFFSFIRNTMTINNEKMGR